MKVLKTILVIFTIGVIVFLSVSCTGGNNATPTTKTTTSTIQRGNISIAVTGTGNLALADTENLAFDIAGTVEEILVEVSNSVKQGQELVKLDTSVWDKQVKTLQKTLDTANRSVDNANRTLASKQTTLTKAQRAVADAELGVRKANLDLQAAQNSLDNISDVKEALAVVDNAQESLKIAQASLQAAIATSSPDVDYYKLQVKEIQGYRDTTTGQHVFGSLELAQQDLKEVLNGTSTTTSKEVALQVAQAQLNLEQKQRAIEASQIAVEDAKISVTNAQLDVTYAQKDLADAQQNAKDAQNDLDETKSLSPVIKAPFDGIITKINVTGGQEIQKGTVAMIIADPNKFGANIMVTETDIFSVKVGADANVSVDALSGLSFPAKITAIAPTATNSQGVINYKVTTELTSLQPTLGGRTTTAQRPAQLFTGGTASTNLPSGGIPTNLPAGAISGGTSGSTSGRTFPAAAAAQNITLKDGLSATVTIPLQEKNDVIVVPSRAIKRQGQNSTVQVIKGTLVETRTIKTGLSDGTNIEVTEGLSEGEQVQITTTSSTSTFGGPGGAGGGMMIVR